MKVLIAIPAYNEAKIIAANVGKVSDFCRQSLADDWQVVIANNQSTDSTKAIAEKLAAGHQNIRCLNVAQKGKGAAIRAAWQAFDADIYCFMDADLATDLSALPDLIAGIKAGNDLVIGDRFNPRSRVRRGWFRRLTSNVYRRVLKILLAMKINDAPCGFKAINQRVKDQVLPQVENSGWFFDSELVVLAEHQGFKVQQVPVIWSEPREAEDKSRVKIFSLAANYFRLAWVLRKRLK